MFTDIDEIEDQSRKLGLLLDKPKPAPDEMSYNPTIEAIKNKLEEVINLSQLCGFTLTFKKKFQDDDDKWLHRHYSAKIGHS